MLDGLVSIRIETQERLRLSDGVDYSRVSVSNYMWWYLVLPMYTYASIHSEIGEGGRWHPEACVLLAVRCA